jgi:hypothetical protein
MFGRKVLPTVDLYRESLCSAEEVEHITTELVLAAELVAGKLTSS